MIPVMMIVISNTAKTGITTIGSFIIDCHVLSVTADGGGMVPSVTEEARRMRENQIVIKREGGEKE